jgi:hypothetical protein
MEDKDYLEGAREILMDWLVDQPDEDHWAPREEVYQNRWVVAYALMDIAQSLRELVKKPVV